MLLLCEDKFIVFAFMSDILHLYAVTTVFMLYEDSLWTSFGPGLGFHCGFMVAWILNMCIWFVLNPALSCYADLNAVAIGSKLNSMMQFSTMLYSTQ
jgi:hypothetical protein